MKVPVAIKTINEEKIHARSLENVKWADEIIAEDSIKAHVAAMNKNTSMEVKKAVKAGYTPTGYSVLIKPLIYFMRHYIFKAGFLDGFAGLVYYSINAMYIFTREIKIMEVKGITGFKLLASLHKPAILKMKSPESFKQ